MPSESKNLSYKNLFLGISVLILVFYFGTPIKAEAGIGSFFSNMFGAQKEEVSDENSQNISLLQANALQSTGGSESDISVESNALKTEVGPLGTTADVDFYYPESDTISLYVIKKGDTLKTVADLFDVSVNTIIWANDIKSGTSLKEGDTLVILPVSGIRYTVKKGDTLASITKKFKADIGDVGLFNGITEESRLAVGDTLILPDGEIVAQVPVKKNNPSNSGKRNKKEKTWGTNAKEASGYYIRPIVGGRKSQGLHGFNGIDIAAPAGTSIRASASGRVIISSSGTYGGGYGNYIVISHDNGTQTLYAHNTKNFVSVGENVEQGQVIGTVGSTGRSTGNHIHFEIRGAKNPF